MISGFFSLAGQKAIGAHKKFFLMPAAGLLLAIQILKTMGDFSVDHVQPLPREAANIPRFAISVSRRRE